MVALGPVQIAGYTPGVAGYGCESGVGGQPAGVGEQGQVGAGGDEEFSAEEWSEPWQALDDVGLGVATELLGDLLVGLFDLTVQVELVGG